MTFIAEIPLVSEANVWPYAHAYSKAGLHFLPLNWPTLKRNVLACSCRKARCASVGKHPFGPAAPNGVKDASNSSEAAQQWFYNTPFNIGIATGQRSRIIALDIDPRNDGDVSLAALENKYGELPVTWRFLTGGGGEHILFKYPDRTVLNSSSKIAPGIDIKGDNGYIVAPPSMHASGRRYAISVDHSPDIVPLADIPDWLLPLILSQQSSTQITKSKKLPAEEWRRRVGTTITEGSRNTTLTSIAGHLLRNRIDPMVTAELLISWGTTHCHPPLDEAEVMSVVRSIAKKEIARRKAGDHACS